MSRLNTFSTRSYFCLFCLVIMQSLLSACAPTTTYSLSTEPPLLTPENTAPIIHESTLGQLLPLIPSHTIHDPNAQLDNDIALQALSAAVREQRWQIAKTIISKSNPASMPVDDYAQFILWSLNYLNQTAQFASAEQQLNTPYLRSKLPLMAAEDQIALSLARAKTLFGLNQFVASAKERVFIEGLIDDSELSKNNQNTIWQTLLKLSLQQLKQQSEPPTHRAYKSWLELAIIYRNNQLSLATQATEVKAWQLRWPKQKLSVELSTTIEAFTDNNTQPLNNIGVFLPLSGRLASAGNAIKDGIAYAYFNNNQLTQHAPSLKFYDTAQNTIEQLYTQAINDNVELIIGPLEKNKVAEFFTMPTDVPIVTLNFITDSLPPPTNIIQFGLAIEDEAKQLAQLAQSTQHQNILLLHTDKDWAKRAASAFKAQWQPSETHKNLTIKMLSIADNYSREISQSLALDQSYARRKTLNNLLGAQLSFKPRRRQDIDLVILFAEAKQAKSIKPLLAYHYASEIPVFGNSKIYNSANTSANNDLNGIFFNEMPWLLNVSNRHNRTANKYLLNKSLNRFFAMGLDAFYLHTRINYLKQDSANELSGATGFISLKNNKIVRRLALAKIKQGKAITAYEKDIPGP